MSEGHDFSLRITPAGAGVDQAEVEELALQLRGDLLTSGIPGVTRVVEGPAPDGTRSAELIAGGIGFLVTGLSTAASVTQIADYVQRWRQAHPRRRRVVVSVEAGATSPEAAACEGKPSGSSPPAMRRKPAHCSKAFATSPFVLVGL
ncbi:hypothetical protein AB0K48_41235, partial [Nonomuraea sp. NPDC055795]